MLTEAGATRAVEAAARCKPLRRKGPFLLTQVFTWGSQADAAMHRHSAERAAAYAVK